MSDLPVAQWFFHVAEVQGRGIMLALLTLTNCAPAETSSPYPFVSTTYSQWESGWQRHSYRLATQQCPEYTMGTQTQRECWR
jgi:hypothetical protein